MKIAISAVGNSLADSIDQRFGRCKYFIIIDTENDKFEAVENQGVAQGHGAGIKAAEQVGQLGVEAVITGTLGPNSTQVLSGLGIKSYHASGSVNEGIKSFKGGKLSEIEEIAEPHSEVSKEKSVDSERVFFPLLDDNGMDSKISDHFGHAPFFGVYEAEKKKLEIIPNDLDHADPSKSPIDQIEEAVSPTTIFAKGIGGRAIAIIKEKGLKLKTGDYDTVKDAIDNLDKLGDQVASCGHEHHY